MMDVKASDHIVERRCARCGSYVALRRLPFRDARVLAALKDARV